MKPEAIERECVGGPHDGLRVKIDPIARGMRFPYIPDRYLPLLFVGGGPLPQVAQAYDYDLEPDGKLHFKS